jgi:prepilin-type N-terminal cleavage/methylation domain-containing protein
MEKVSMKNSQRGYSLIELSIVLAIIAVVIGGAITGVQAILQSNNVNKTISTTNKSVGGITAKLLRDNTYVNATTANLSSRSMGIWDEKSVTSPGLAAAAVTNEFGGQVFVASLATVTYGIAINQAYIYTLTGIPTASCTDLVLGLESLALGVAVNNQLPNAVTAAPTALSGTVVKQPGTLPNSLTVSGACAPAVDTGKTTITLLIPRS